MKIIDGGVTAPKGYKAAGIYAGIKKKRKDMALVYSVVPASGAGVFTTNVVKAAPVKWDIKLTKESKNIQAVIINSGVANACTGEEGWKNNYLMAKTVAENLNLSTEAVYTASTGVIGKQLPIDIIVNNIPKLVGELKETKEAGTLAAEAIMTTDTYSKECAVTFSIGGKEVTLGGMAKGSGMIHPNMATMIAVLTTDLSISKELLQEALSEDVKHTFNMISVDRDTSTNDTLVILANGMAGNPEIKEKNEDYYTFCKALNMVTTKLSKMLAADGEGATKLLEVTVNGAKTWEDAATLSKSVISSNLVKSMIFGKDANWGRVLCALGYSGVDFDPEKVDLVIESTYGSLMLAKDGLAVDYSEEKATDIFAADEVKVLVDIKQGSAAATAWGCDLTYDYVKINADYRS
ncbi:glutamate N-acetyltransferase [Herbinix hemicellulosilytica]|uniref:Arginine biosynthesis bifunctional protein ArgJ n=1 Tax=Herbinix hemicellulosilytica TaxID=1564487 RepID=A0A0H5SWG9_HERHM|nr:bifunctional ornithine acetyltransferase/N-acetylglutamate synthase [Herbinix hemicellulosilytica]RBP59604.1 glutamate N-acetyltransferase [Herbinix hemicellulosilytica]CRZ34683.1 Arginine biosynthesis bifunctional protein ArgJ 1 [Herbinix hemicellulosilytica]